jgi:CDP-diacylglycerol--serine O-phosphatidyltransferase
VLQRSILSFGCRTEGPVTVATDAPARYIPFMSDSSPSPFDLDRSPRKHPRFQRIPVRVLVPNLITLLALCAGLTAIKVAAEGNLELALMAIVFAAVLDGIDGRVARLLKGTSRFGAELDSLADFVNFGVAPGLMLYFWGLHELKSAGWIASMIFAISAGLRLARFNVMIDDPNRPAWAANFFVGVPAPAGAILVLLPLYLHFLDMPRFAATVPVTMAYTIAIAFLMVSKLPVFSGKKVGTRVSPDMVLPIFVAVCLFFALLISYPWWVLTIGAVAYLGSLPFGYVAYRKNERRDAAPVAPAASSTDEVPAATRPPTATVIDERPTRLN